MLSKINKMQKTKTHTLIIRGVSKEQKNSLKRLADGKNQSVNGFFLTNITNITEKDIEVWDIKQAELKERRKKQALINEFYGD